MSRVIKFRGFDENYNIVYGKLVYNNVIKQTKKIMVDGKYSHDECEDFKIRANTVGQFTGLCDKNGKEIFEGDILHAFHEEFEEFIMAQVSFENGTFTIGRYWKDGIHDWHSMEQYDSFNIKIIGNIHENPELLK